MRIATGYVVRVLVDEPESKLYGMLGRGAFATVNRNIPLQHYRVCDQAWLFRLIKLA